MFELDFGEQEYQLIPKKSGYMENIQNKANCESLIVQIVQACNGDLEIMGKLIDLYDSTNHLDIDYS
jgi:transcription elongation factor GreA-like protein